MKYTTVLITKVEDADFNPNRMDHNDYVILLETVTKEKCLLQPPLVRERKDGKLTIIDGHHRMRAAREAGLKKVPVVILAEGEHLDDRILQIAMNKIRGRLDLTGVGQLAQELMDDQVPLDDILLSGYNQPDILELIESLSENDTSIDLDDMSSLQTNDDTKKPKPFTLELEFTNRDDMKACRKALKRASSNGELADGLISVLGLDDDAEIA